MRRICVNYLLILLVKFALSAAENATTVWPDKLEFSTVLPRPIDSTNPSTSQQTISQQTINQTDQFGLKTAENQKSRKESDRENQTSSANSGPANLTSERARTSKLLSAGSLPFGTKLSKRPVDLPRNQSFANVDLHSNLTVISGRSSSPPDDLQSKQSRDDFYGDHMSAYDKIKIKNDKFSYDHFFELYDGLLPDSDQDASAKSQPTKTTHEDEHSVDPYQHLVQYRPANMLPLTAQLPNAQQPYPTYPAYAAYPPAYPSPNHLPYEYPLAHAGFVQPSYSTIQKFSQYQRQRIKELLHRPVSEMFAGKFKPDYVPKYQLEAPQRSHQQTGLGELFIVLGPLVILPLLSSFALSTFTTLYVTKSLIGRPAAASTNAARHKQFNGKLLKEETPDFNQSALFNLVQPNESLVYHPFNASEFDLQVLRSRNNERMRKADDGLEREGAPHSNKTSGIKSRQINHKDQKEFKSLEEESLKGLKRSRRSNLRHDLILAELGLDAVDSDAKEPGAAESGAADSDAADSGGTDLGGEDSNPIKGGDIPKKRVRRWNEVLWTKPKPQQTPWLPLTKKLARQPRNSLHKLFIVRPTKKVYKSLSKERRLKDMATTKNVTKNQQINHNFNQPSNLLRFAINDVIAGGKQTTGLLETTTTSEFDTANHERRDSDKRSDDEPLHPLSAASSPTPTYVNFTGNVEPSFAGFEANYQPKVYNLRTNHSPEPLTEQQLLKRQSATGQPGAPSYRTNAVASHLANSFPATDKNETGNFQRVTLLNPFHTPSFLMESKNARVEGLSAAHSSDAARTQARSKGARKLDLNAGPRKDWEKELDAIPLDDWTEEHDFTGKNRQEVSSLNSDLDVVQKYLKQTRPDGEYNDEIIATYLSCNGLLSEANQCLQRLVCQYVDNTVKMPDLEKEVASLIIYSILKNKYIEDHVKKSMRLAAQHSIQKLGQCAQYHCLRVKPTRN